MRILIFCYILFSNCYFGQNIKSEIGTSNWIKEGSIIVNSVIDHKYHFDKQGNEVCEWKINREPKKYNVLAK
jgi:hypothetical protein